MCHNVPADKVTAFYWRNLSLAHAKRTLPVTALRQLVDKIYATGLMTWIYFYFECFSITKHFVH